MSLLRHGSTPQASHERRCAGSAGLSLLNDGRRLPSSSRAARKAYERFENPCAEVLQRG